MFIFWHKQEYIPIKGGFRHHLSVALPWLMNNTGNPAPEGDLVCFVSKREYQKCLIKITIICFLFIERRCHQPATTDRFPGWKTRSQGNIIYTLYSSTILSSPGKEYYRNRVVTMTFPIVSP